VEKSSAYRLYDDGNGLRDFNVLVMLWCFAVGRGGEDTQITINLSYDNAGMDIGALIGAASCTVIM